MDLCPLMGLSIVMLTINYEYEIKNFQNQQELIECPISLEISKNPALCLKVRLDWTRSKAKRRLATFANLRKWLLIFAAGRFIG